MNDCVLKNRHNTGGEVFYYKLHNNEKKADIYRNKDDEPIMTVDAEDVIPVEPRHFDVGFGGRFLLIDFFVKFEELKNN